jgi:hypothetical protein
LSGGAPVGQRVLMTLPPTPPVPPEEPDEWAEMAEGIARLTRRKRPRHGPAPVSGAAAEPNDRGRGTKGPSWRPQDGTEIVIYLLYGAGLALLLYFCVPYLWRPVHKRWEERPIFAPSAEDRALIKVRRSAQAMAPAIRQYMDTHGGVLPESPDSLNLGNITERPEAGVSFHFAIQDSGLVMIGAVQGLDHPVYCDWRPVDAAHSLVRCDHFQKGALPSPVTPTELAPGSSPAPGTP